MADRQTWRPILFDCPLTGQKVQGLIAEEATGESYDTVNCLACAGVHFIDRTRGTVVGVPRKSGR